MSKQEEETKRCDCPGWGLYVEGDSVNRSVRHVHEQERVILIEMCDFMTSATESEQRGDREDGKVICCDERLGMVR